MFKKCYGVKILDISFDSFCGKVKECFRNLTDPKLLKVGENNCKMFKKVVENNPNLKTTQSDLL